MDPGLEHIMDLNQVTLVTRDLVLREFVATDWEAVHSYASDPENIRYMLWGPNREEDTRAFLEQVKGARMEMPRRHFELAVTFRKTNQLIGAVGLRIQSQPHRSADLGYILHRSHWRQGFGSQAARAMVEFGFEHLSMHRIWATCHVENIGSARLLEGIGMQYEGTMRSNHVFHGEWSDSKLFAILATDEAAKR